MSRTSVRQRFVCGACGYESPKWLGRCTECAEWGSVTEQAAPSSPAVTPTSQPVPIAAVDGLGAATRPTGLGEFDRVLGGGLVAGSVTLLGGEPGMGKSTLVLQTLGAMAAAGARCLLVGAEESPAQVRLRADRLGTLDDELFVVGEASLPAIVAHVEAIRPAVLAVDSIQTVHDPDGPGSAGSVAQVRDGAQRLVRLAKEHGIATIIVGHVTKDGTLAGPRVLEHVVDTVLSFDGDRHHSLRMLRASKHRFGATDELGVMEMTETGLAAVADPSAMFLADRQPGATGSVVTAVMEGSRPLCVEMQALISPTNAHVPRRIAQGFDNGRLAMLVAILEQHGDCKLSDAEVYASGAGDARVAEPGADLSIALAIASARNENPLAADTVVMGELGLGGEIRQVPHARRRLAEAQRLGFARAVAPRSTPAVDGIELIGVGTLGEALDATGVRTR